MLKEDCPILLTTHFSLSLFFELAHYTRKPRLAVSRINQLRLGPLLHFFLGKDDMDRTDPSVSRQPEGNARCSLETSC